MVVLGNPAKIPVEDVVATQHLRCTVNGELPPSWLRPPTTSPTLEPVFMDIYTGWIVVGIASAALAGWFGVNTNDISRNAFVSFVPLGSKTGDHFDVQGYPFGTTAIVSASPASFATSDTPSTCAIDSATVEVRDVPAFSAGVLVLTANYAIQSCYLNRVAYQVTVFAPQGRAVKFNKVSLPAGTLVPD